jgi:hypothetical protein
VIPKRSIGGVLALAVALILPAAAHAETFLGAFGMDVDPLTVGFGTCTVTCQNGGTTGDGGLDMPNAVAVAPDGSLYVADRGHGRVARYTVDAAGQAHFSAAFGAGVSTGAATLETCTSACQNGGEVAAATGYGGPLSVAVAGDGTIVVSGVNPSRISLFHFDTTTSEASLEASFGVGAATGSNLFETCTTTCMPAATSAIAGGLDWPSGLAITSGGTIVVADTNRGRVSRFTFDHASHQATFLDAFGTGVRTGANALETCTTGTGCQAGIVAPNAGSIHAPASVAVGPDGTIVVGDILDGSVSRFAFASGQATLLGAFGDGVRTGAPGLETCVTGCQPGLRSDGPGGNGDPYGLGVDADGSILVSDSLHNRVERFGIEGGQAVFRSAFGAGVVPGAPSGFEVCTTSCQAGSGTGAAGALNGPTNLTLADDGTILVADSGNNRIVRFAGPPRPTAPTTTTTTTPTQAAAPDPVAPEPGAAPAPAPTATVTTPAAKPDLRIRASRLVTHRFGRVTLRLTNPTAQPLTLTRLRFTDGRRTLASHTPFRLAAHETRKVTLRLGHRAKHARKATLNITLTTGTARATRTVNRRLGGYLLFRDW